MNFASERDRLLLQEIRRGNAQVERDNRIAELEAERDRIREALETINSYSAPMDYENHLMLRQVPNYRLGYQVVKATAREALNNPNPQESK